MSLERVFEYLEDPRTYQVSASRRGLFKMAAVTGAAALGILGEAESVEAKPKGYEEMLEWTPKISDATALSPISIPEIGITSQTLNLEALPAHIQRLIIFFTGLGCAPCEILEKKMKTASASRPRDTVVIPVAGGLTRDDFSKLTPYEVCQGTFDLQHGPGYVQPKGEINDGGCDHIRRWLRGKYEFFTQQCESPGIYHQVGDRPISGGASLPSIAVVQRSSGRISRPSREKWTYCSSQQVWSAILGK